MHSHSIPPAPGTYLKDKFLVPLNIAETKLARDLDVTVSRIFEIIRMRRGITPNTALRLARYFQTTPEFWLKLQLDYDLYQEKTKRGGLIEQAIRPCLILPKKLIE
jgi:addiction module HigA family antidote